MADATISSLHLYPVKGGRAVDVDALAFTPDGLIVGDRAAMVVDAATGRFVSQRQVAKLALLTASLPAADGTLTLAFPSRDSIEVRPQQPSPRRVTVWDDAFDADDAGDDAAAWLGACLGREVRLVRLGPPGRRTLDPYWTPGLAPVATSFADLAPLLVTSVASLAELNRRRVIDGLAAVSMSRFRPNVVIEGLTAFAEDQVERLVNDDGVTLRLIKPCARCNVTEIDQRSGEPRGDRVLMSLASFRSLTNRRGTRGVMFGQNAVLDEGQGGAIRVGERLSIFE